MEENDGAFNLAVGFVFNDSVLHDSVKPFWMQFKKVEAKAETRKKSEGRGPNSPSTRNCCGRFTIRL